MEINKHLPAVIQNLELQKQGQVSQIGEENKLSVALAEKKIRDLPETEVRKAVKYALFKLGIRAKNFPEGVEKSLLLDHIFKVYGNHTPQEIRLAFDLALEGKLEVEVNCYENFSCAYFSTIMNAYRSWAAQVIKQKEGEQKVIEKKPDLEQIEKEYQEFLKTPLAQKYKPNL
jgi:hypothetical protein